MTYSQTLEYLFSQLPMYHRIGAAAYKADIQPTIDMMSALGNPQCRFRSIHVAGTNGKGSVSHCLASILQEAGYRVGLYTSPHLVDFRERIRVNGQKIPQQEVVEFVDQYHSLFEQLKLSFFEMTVGMAFDFFARQQVDVAVVEVGMGGRLDSTNVITPDLSIITNIGLDHTQFLGDTLEKIAREKAGIIKPTIPVVIGQTQPETIPVFTQVAAQHAAPLYQADQHFHIEILSDTVQQLRFSLFNADHLFDGLIFESPLAGTYQRYNMVTVAESVACLRTLADYNISNEAFQRGIAHVVKNTHLHGRWQVLDYHPLTLCETAHNADGIAAMIDKLRSLDFSVLHLVYGCVNDKDSLSILRFLNHSLNEFGRPIIWHFTQPSVPRRKPVSDLVQQAASIGIVGAAHEDVQSAISVARKEAADADLVLVTGSIFLIADALEGNLDEDND